MNMGESETSPNTEHNIEARNQGRAEKSPMVACGAHQLPPMETWALNARRQAHCSVVPAPYLGR